MNAAGSRRPVGALLLFLAAALASCAPDPRASGTTDHAAHRPAARIVALSPHLTELVFAAGAGAKLVGVVEFSNHPPAAQALPRVGDAFHLDFEALAAVRPDLVLGWPSGNSPRTLDRLRRLGYRVVDLEPGRLDDLGAQIEAIGALAGTEAAARPAAAAWRSGLESLRTRYAAVPPVRVFYQVAPQPLITVTARHFIGQAIELCGGRNVFADVAGLSPVVGAEAVVAAAPEVIVASDFTRVPGEVVTGSPLDRWRSWSRMPAVANGRLAVIDPDLMSVPGPRLLDGIARLCRAISPEVSAASP